MKTILLGGPSRSGKTAIAKILALGKTTGLPFNTPDPEWINDAYTDGEINEQFVIKYMVNYFLCYSWYENLGRHINLRETDTYSMAKMKFIEHSRLTKEYFIREDNDLEFYKFLKRIDVQEITPIFQVNLSNKICRKIEEQYPLRIFNYYSTRAPIEFLLAWLWGNRMDRGNNLSRRMQFNANLKSGDTFYKMFVPDETLQHEVSEVNGVRRFTTFTQNSEKINELKNNGILLSMVKNEYNKSIQYHLDNKGLSFEIAVTNPKKIIEKISNETGVNFVKDIDSTLDEYLNVRSVDETYNNSYSKAKTKLEEIGFSQKEIDELWKMQENYIKVSGL